jgi:YHS domain-containing protein
MNTEYTLAERIRDKLEQHQRELADKQQLLDNEMKEMLEEQERYVIAAKHQIESVVKPRMEELVRHFDNVEVEVITGDTVCMCVCEFAHIPRFPASVRFGIALSSSEEGRLTARYDLSIFPILMNYTRNAEESFLLEDNDDSLATWVDDRILDFVDTYLRLETHPLYQKDNLVTDPVCGMRISAIAAKCSIEWPGRTIYFCSEVCKEAFSRGEK